MFKRQRVVRTAGQQRIQHHSLHSTYFGKRRIPGQHRLLLGDIGSRSNTQFQHIGRTQHMERQQIGIVQLPQILALIIPEVRHLQRHAFILDLLDEQIDITASRRKIK